MNCAVLVQRWASEWRNSEKRIPIMAFVEAHITKFWPIIDFPMAHIIKIRPKHNGRGCICDNGFSNGYNN